MSEKKRTVYDMILAMYADEDNMRQWLNEPFFKGEYAYATDTLCMIRVPVAKTNCTIPLPDNHGSKVLSIFPESSNVNHVIRVSDLEATLRCVPFVPEYYNASSEGRCFECGGTGYVDWEYKDCIEEYECPVCDGSGSLVSSKREPTGQQVYDSRYLVAVSENDINPVHLRLVLDTAKLLQADTITLVHQDKDKTNTFTIGSDVTLLVSSKLITPGDIRISLSSSKQS